MLIVAICLLAGCAPGAPGAATAPPATATSPAATANPATGEPAAPPATAAPAPETPGAGWRRVQWQGLSIPIPPDAQWQPNPSFNAQIPGVTVISAGTITYPKYAGPVEAPYGPHFAILAFDGSFDDWIEIEKRLSPPGNPVDAQTVRRVQLVGRDAVAYQRAVIGADNTGYYAVKLDDRRLLWIMTDDIENPVYRRVLDMLEIGM